MNDADRAVAKEMPTANRLAQTSHESHDRVPRWHPWSCLRNAGKPPTLAVCLCPRPSPIPSTFGSAAAKPPIAAAAAGNAALRAHQRYSGEVVDFQTVLDTQRTQLVTQDSVVAAGVDLSADHVRLYKALGGGWQPDGSNATADGHRAPRS